MRRRRRATPRWRRCVVNSAGVASPAAVQIASLFAIHASHALGRRLAEQQLTAALSTRKIIGQAVGIVMERYRLSEQQAFTFLVRASHDTGTRLRLIAAQLVDDVDRRGTIGGPPDEVSPDGRR